MTADETPLQHVRNLVQGLTGIMWTAEVGPEYPEGRCVVPLSELRSLRDRAQVTLDQLETLKRLAAESTAYAVADTVRKYL